MPGGALVIHHVHALAETCDGVLASAALLGHAALVAVHAEDLILVVGEAGARQRFRAGAAHEAVTVPRLLLVAHPPGGDRLFAADALLGKLLVVAGAAVYIASFGDETLRADWPFAGNTGEAVVVPRVAFVLHTLHTCQDGFVAAVAAGCVLSGAALPAHDAIILGAERLFGQRLVALGAAKTVLVPVAPLVAQLLRLHRDWSVALGAGVGAEFGVTADAHRLALVTDKLLPTQVLPAVEAVGVVCHLGSGAQGDT